MAQFTSVTNGYWDDGATWGNVSPGVSGTDFPGTGDDALIQVGTTVTWDSARPGAQVTGTEEYGKIELRGTLTIAQSPGKFSFGELGLYQFGVFRGDATGAVRGDRTYIEMNKNRGQGLLSVRGGNVNFVGVAPSTKRAELADHGDNYTSSVFLRVKGDVSGDWQNGDMLAIADPVGNKDVQTIGLVDATYDSATGTTILTLDRNVQFMHTSGLETQYMCYVWNVERSWIITQYEQDQEAWELTQPDENGTGASIVVYDPDSLITLEKCRLRLYNLQWQTGKNDATGKVSVDKSVFFGSGGLYLAHAGLDMISTGQACVAVGCYKGALQAAIGGRYDIDMVGCYHGAYMCAGIELRGVMAGCVLAMARVYGAVWRGKMYSGITAAFQCSGLRMEGDIGDVRRTFQACADVTVTGRLGVNERGYQSPVLYIGRGGNGGDGIIRVDGAAVSVSSGVVERASGYGSPDVRLHAIGQVDANGNLVYDTQYNGRYTGRGSMVRFVPGSAGSNGPTNDPNGGAKPLVKLETYAGGAPELTPWQPLTSWDDVGKWLTPGSYTIGVKLNWWPAGSESLTSGNNDETVQAFLEARYPTASGPAVERAGVTILGSSKDMWIMWSAGITLDVPGWVTACVKVTSEFVDGAALYLWPEMLVS